MINLILHYLLALPDVATAPSSNPRDLVSAARKRKSMDLASMVAAKSEVTADPLLFSLVDLILACLRSQSQQTIYVTLQLVSAILKRHHRYAVITLLQTDVVNLHSESAHRTSGAHQQEVEYLMALAGTIGGQDNFNEIYESVLQDTMIRLEGHPCSLKLVAPKTTGNNHKQLPAIPDSLPGAPRDVRPHTLRPDDPVLNIVLDRLETFFLNPVETNLALTEAIFDLAVCGYMTVEGWFLRSPQKYLFDEDEDEGEAPEASLDPESPEYAEYVKLRSLNQCRRRPRWMPSNLPRLLTTLQLLVDEVTAYREIIPRFDDLLQQRREAFQTTDSSAPTRVPSQAKNATSHPPSAVNTPAVVRTSQDESRNASPARPSGLEGFAQRILSEFGTPSRSNSPRGRKEQNRSSSDRSTPVPIPPREFPMNLDTPGRERPQGGFAARSYSPHSATSAPGSWDGKGDPVSSQMKAFHAIDQSILNRRVGIPSIKGKDALHVEPIPLRFQTSPPPRVEVTDQVEENQAEDGPVADHGVKEDQPREDRSEENRPEEGQTDETPAEENQTIEETVGADEEAPSSDDGKASTAPPHEEATASVSHVLTNTIILQSFLFELTSLVQVRAAVFDEVRFA